MKLPFFPTIETTYNYTLFGNINGTEFRATWTCSPAEGEPMSDNSTKQISDGVIRKALQEALVAHNNEQI